METAMKGRDLLTMSDLSADELRLILDLAIKQKSEWIHGDRRHTHSDKSVALIFLKPSLRTRVSFEVACHRLGVHPVVLAGGDSVFSRGESVHDSIKTLERYVDVICIRTFEHSQVEEFAGISQVPVINMLTDDHHPCQGLADLLTIKEHFGGFAGLTMAYLGDGNNMANTYLLAGAIVGMNVVVASPADYEPAVAVVKQAQLLSGQTDASIRVVRDPCEAVSGANIVVTDTWTSMGQEDEHATRLTAFSGYRVDENMMRLAGSDAVFMHCLPAHRGEEVTDAVLDAPNSLIFEQAENRLHVQKALLSLVIG